jgi:protein TonB
VAAADAAAQARVRELEARVAQLEREKQEAETRAADQARLDLEAQARAGGRVVDPAAIERAQAEARRRARAEEDARQQEELRRIEDEKKAEEARLAEATPSPAPTPTPSPSPEAATASAVEPAAPAGADAGAGSAPAADVAPAPAAPPTPVPRGSLVDPGDPALTPPVLVREVKAVFPDIARVARATGIVEVRALVDENGNVTDVALVRSSRPGVQFEVEADRAVRRFKYRPGTREGVPVKTWVRVRVRFGAAE